MHEIPELIAGLGSDLLHGKDLPMALKHMLASLTETRPRVCASRSRTVPRQPYRKQVPQLLLVIQEAVSNCIRHGHALEAQCRKMLKQGVG